METKGMIFDISRNSFVDGPGIRTTVFFKGCNLRCAWCHNPESQSFACEMLFYPNKCTGCGKCREICPHSLASCDLCGRCVTYCRGDARKICGEEKTVDEVMHEVVKDKAFYDASGGGVTFSGGECMLQPDFLEALLRACREKGIRTAVDTAGCVPFSLFERILPLTDLFLYDIKAIDPELHQRYVGKDNALILENLTALAARGAQIIVRVPVIGGVNARDDEMRKIAEFTASCGIREVELLPYHAMGEYKYEALGKRGETFTIPDPVKTEEWRTYFR